MTKPTAHKIPQNTIAEQAKRTVFVDRETVYGHPAIDFTRMAMLFTAQLSGKLTEPLTPEDVAQLMILTKLSRLAQTPEHDDSLVDIVGYALCYERIKQHRADPSAELLSVLLPNYAV